jgi:hypothetical protein
MKANSAAGEQLSYWLTQPSQVTAAVVDPSGVSHPVDSGSKQPGTYTFSYTSLDTEGTWHWHVEATDAQNRSSTADQTFVYDLTLTGLTVPKSASVSSGLRVGFTLSRPASVVLSISAANGTPVATLPAAQLQAGAQSLTWDGTMTSGKPLPGSYVATVTETSQLGTTSLHAPFTFHR